MTTTERTPMPDVECLGSFQAQQFKLLSADPNTIFQFFVYPDYLILLRIGTALNQIPQILLHSANGPVGLNNYAPGGLPSLREARDLAEADARPQKLRLEMKSTKSRCLPAHDVTLCEYRSSGIFSRGLHLHLRDGEKLFFRFLTPEHLSTAQRVLPASISTFRSA